MKDKKKELVEWLEDKKENTLFRMMIYASISFKKQREGVHNLCLKLSKADNVLYHKINIFEDVVCGWADDTPKLISICYPEFKEKFYKGISLGDLENIIENEILLTGKNNA